MEENEEQSPCSPHYKKQQQQQQSRGRRAPENVNIEQWLSPLSDHFPTPRGFHFLSAPIMPESPSVSDADELDDVDDISSQASSSNPASNNSWNRASTSSNATDFDDIYDLSDEERERKEVRRANSRKAANASKTAANSGKPVKTLPRLIIPGAARDSIASPMSARSLKKNLMSPVAPTPSSIVDMSPAIKSFMEAQQKIDVLSISAPPSLDGSLTSEQMAQISAPPTPVIGAEDDEGGEWGGVQLQPGALATLRALSRGGDEDGSSTAGDEHAVDQVIEMSQQQQQQQQQQPPQPQMEMAEMHHATPRLITSFQTPLAETPSLTHAPSLRRSLAGLTRLDIPSPGGFFSDLSPRSRRTWHLPGGTPADEVAPPTSTTAEQFYKTPWAAEEMPPMPRPAAQPAPKVVAEAPRSAIEEANRPLPLAQRAAAAVAPVEQFAEVSESLMGDPPTAIRIPAEPLTAKRLPPSSPMERSSSPVEAVAEIVSSEEVAAAKGGLNFAELQKSQAATTSHIDRTQMWLRAQKAYLKGVGEDISTAEKEEEKSEEEVPALPTVKVEPEEETKDATATTDLKRKKTVHFSTPPEPKNLPRSLPSKLARLESSYYRAFQDLTVRTNPRDAFNARQARFEAVQASRVSLREAHRNSLLGKHQLSVSQPQSAKKRMSANVARRDHDVDTAAIEDPDKLRADKEDEALSQMRAATWHVAATKMLNGGKLIASPAAKRLARTDKARILDLGGQGTCDWAWHVALAHPNAKIYTVTTKQIRQLSNANIRGPPNHRQVAVTGLTKLPFADNHFDVVSARELHSCLKFVGENGADEWEACLAECRRVLKPGGYLEFSVLDSEVMNAGPQGLAHSVEFGFALRTLGYDPNPSRMFLGRLARAGLVDVRRAWMCLPMGPKPVVKSPPPVPAKTAKVAEQKAGKTAGLKEMLGKKLPPLDSFGRPNAKTAANTATATTTSGSAPRQGRTLQLEATLTGSTDAISSVTGLLAGWSWERWLLRAEMERSAGELRLADTVTGSGDAMAQADKSLDGVQAVIEEGRVRGSGWRLLRGYARKPLEEAAEEKQVQQEKRTEMGQERRTDAVKKSAKAMGKMPAMQMEIPMVVVRDETETSPLGVSPLGTGMIEMCLDMSVM
jgi:SAM-dependent methyltransferase